MATNYTVYPYALDGYSTLPLVRDGIDEIVAAHHNSLRSAIVAIEGELGVNPSGSFATVADRLDQLTEDAASSASAVVSAHISDTSDAHDASAISILDTEDLFYGTDVEVALNELGVLFPDFPDGIGYSTAGVVNSAVPSFTTKFMYNVGDFSGETLDNEIKRTQPRTVNGISGIHVLEFSSSIPNGTGYLFFDSSTKKISFRAPGDLSAGTAIDISSLSAGDTQVLQSATITKTVRIVRTSVSLPSTGIKEEQFEVFGLDPVTGEISIDSVGFKTTSYLTRAAVNETGVSRNQFVISGVICPADLGTLVLQKKRLGDADFYPIAVLDLEDNFSETTRSTGQDPYVPTLADFDVITLYDRVPALRTYTDTDADGNVIYSSYSSDYYRAQLAKYVIPASNSVIVAGGLTASPSADITDMEDAISAFRIVHYKSGVSDFTGEPDSGDVYSLFDVFGSADDGDSNVRISNVFVDSNKDRPGIEEIYLTAPRPDTVEESTVFLSGIKYYDYDSNPGVNRFGFRFGTNDNVFSNSFLRDGIVNIYSNEFEFPHGGVTDGYTDGYAQYGHILDIENLWVRDAGGVDGYACLSTTNLPQFDDKAWYFAGAGYNTSRKAVLPVNKFGVSSHIKVVVNDPFGSGDGYDGYGDDDRYVFDRINAVSNLRTRILVNSYSATRSTDTKEYFTDEEYRVGEEEDFSFLTDSDKFTYFDGPHTTTGDVLVGWAKHLPLPPASLQCGGLWNSEEQNLCGLIYPQNNYASGSIMPFQFDEAITYDSNGVDVTYSAPNLSGTARNYDGYHESAGYWNKYYQRMFNLGYPTIGGKLRIVSGIKNPVSFSDIAYFNSNRCIKVEVKVPGDGYDGQSTLWLDVGKPVGFDGDGALSGVVSGSAGDITVPFSFGGISNGAAGNMTAVRVTYYYQNNYYNTVISNTKTKIITYMELLDPNSSDDI